MQAETAIALTPASRLEPRPTQPVVTGHGDRGEGRTWKYGDRCRIVGGGGTVEPRLQGRVGIVDYATESGRWVTVRVEGEAIPVAVAVADIEEPRA